MNEKLKQSLKVYDDKAGKPTRTNVASLQTAMARQQVLVGNVANFEVRTAERYAQGLCSKAKYDWQELCVHADSNNVLRTWRCNLEQGFTGTWADNGWVETSVFDEIEYLKGIGQNMEAVTVKCAVNRGSGTPVGTTLTVIYDAGTGQQSQTFTVPASGEVTFGVTYGYTYQIQVQDITGYKTPTFHSYTAAMKQRVITYTWRQYNSGCYIVDTNGVETDYLLWDRPAGQAVAVKYTDSTLNVPGGTHDNSIVIAVANPARYNSSKKWQIEYKDIPNLPNKSNSTAAGGDYNGANNSNIIYTDVTTKNSQNKDFVDLYNDAQGTSITVNDYIPALMYCRNSSITISNTVINGYLPAMGQLIAHKINEGIINEALVAAGGAALPTLTGGVWWSSTENYINYAWFLNGGAVDYYRKTYSVRVVPYYDLSNL